MENYKLTIDGNKLTIEGDIDDSHGYLSTVFHFYKKFNIVFDNSEELHNFIKDNNLGLEKLSN